LVFWSKNFEPFLEPLKLINEMGYHSIFHFTITGLPSVFETNLVKTEVAVETLKRLSERYSPKHITWRYDPIVISDRTSLDFHAENFHRLASSLAGHVKRCYFSYAVMYGRVERNFRWFQEKNGINVTDPDPDLRRKLAGELEGIAKSKDIQLYTCCGDYLISDTIKKARCVDSDLIGELFGIDCSGLRTKPTRKDCGCTESTDIGSYDTCPHGCIYCYANVNKAKARKAYESHDKNSAFLGYSKAESDKWVAELNSAIQQSSERMCFSACQS
jgi:hypothetical protein